MNYQKDESRASDSDLKPSEEDTKPEETIPSEVSEEITFPEGGARAWFVALGASTAIFCTFGYANAFGVYQQYYETHQLKHTSPSSISWIGSIQIFILFAGTLFGGPLFDRYGEKTLWQFMLAQGILGGVSMGMVMGPSMAATGQYFNKKRGAAMGMVIAGSSLGGVIFPIALSKMLVNPHLGFGWTVRICAFIMVPLLLVACFGIKARLPPRKGTFFIPAAFKEFEYDSIILSVFLMMIGFFIPFFYLPTYAVEHGMGVQLASYLVSILNGASFFGRVIPGILADKFGRLNMLCVAAFSTCILIFCWPKTSSNASIIVFAGLYGFFSGAIVSLISVCLAQVPKDPSTIGTYMGMGFAVASTAALIGPPINGALVTKYGGFDQASIFSGVAVLLGGVGVLITRYATGKGVFAKI